VPRENAAHSGALAFTSDGWNVAGSASMTLFFVIKPSSLVATSAMSGRRRAVRSAVEGKEKKKWNER